MCNSEGRAKAYIFINTTAPLGLTHSGYGRQTWPHTHTNTHTDEVRSRCRSATLSHHHKMRFFTLTSKPLNLKLVKSLCESFFKSPGGGSTLTARRLNKKTTDVVAGKCLGKGVRFINSTSGNKGPPSNASQSSEFKKTFHFVPLKI